MKKLWMVVLPLWLLAACTKDISRFNDETKKPASAPAATLFANALKNMSDGLTSASVNTNPFRFTVKHWAMSLYQDEAQYNFTTRSIPQAWWTRMYKDVLIDLKDAARLITADELMEAREKANKLAVVDVMQVYAFSNLVNTFGDIPYTEALDPDNLFPRYDDAKTVYADLMKRLSDDIGKFDATGIAFTAVQDLLYGGNVSLWIKFANSLRLKMGMIIADEDNTAARTAVEAADANSFSAASDNALFKYKDVSPTGANPLYTDIIVGKRTDYVAAKDLMDILVAWSDPRKSNFFGTNNDGNYAGGIVGAGNVFTAMSRPSAKVSDATAPCVFLDYSETEFFKAEAKERGYTVAGTAESHYNNAIRASIIYWGGTNADADAYLARPEVAYATATGTWKQKIGVQKWIALYNRPVDGWTELRRLDYPQLSPAINAVTGFPARYTYPGNEQQLNGTNYTDAAAKIGGDVAVTKIFWDKY